MLFLIMLFLSFISCNGSGINQEEISFDTNQEVVNKKEILLSHQEIVGKAHLISSLIDLLVQYILSDQSITLEAEPKSKNDGIVRLIINGMPYELHCKLLSDYAMQFHNPHINGQVVLDDIINVNGEKCAGKIAGEISLDSGTFNFNLALKDQDKIAETQVKVAQFLSNFK